MQPTTPFSILYLNLKGPFLFPQVQQYYRGVVLGRIPTGSVGPVGRGRRKKVLVVRARLEEVGRLSSSHVVPEHPSRDLRTGEEVPDIQRGLTLTPSPVSLGREGPPEAL